MNSNEKSLKNVLDDLIQKKNWKYNLEKASVEDCWKDLMGPSVMKRTRSVHYKEGRLFVKLSSATLKQELFYSRNTIQNRLNETIGGKLVDEVVFL